MSDADPITRLNAALEGVLFQNSAERELVSLQEFVGPQTRHSRSTWRVLAPISGAWVSEAIWGEIEDDSS